MIVTRYPRIAFALICALAAMPAPAPLSAAQAAPQDTSAEIKFSGKVFEVKHRDPRALLNAIVHLGSGFKGTGMSFSDEFKTITVRDFPQNIVSIEEALKRLDAPEPSRPDIELKMHVLIAAGEEGPASQFPAELNDVVKQLQATLSYKSYHLLSSIIQRVRDGAEDVRGSGTAQATNLVINPGKLLGPVNATYNYEIRGVSASPGAGPASALQLRRFIFNLNTGGVLGEANLKTDLGVRDGEKVVVGTASLKDKALILVLSARFVK